MLQRYSALLFGVCLHYVKNEEDARDLVQQVFVKVIGELPKYRVTYFKAWLYQIARNECLMKLRNQKGKIPAVLQEEELNAGEETEAEDNRQEKERQLLLLEESLEELNAEQKQCLSLFYLEQLSYQEIAEATGLSLLQVKSHLQNGRRNLKLLLAQKLAQSKSS
ncbi:MAG: RNA polymerase sigma factor [Chitinophagaceae bacterium]